MIDKNIILRFSKIDPQKHLFYSESVEIEKALSPHSEGGYPVHLMDTARPNEQDVYKQYRRSVFEPITKTYYDKVLNLLGKIWMAEDWSVKYPELDASSKFPENETPVDYLQKKYPDFRSIENWFFSIALNNMIDDPNAVFAVFPDSYIILDNEYVKPIVHTFDAQSVLYYENNKLCVCQINEIPLGDQQAISELGAKLTADVSILVFMDTNTVEKYIKIQGSETEGYLPYYIYEHNTGILPCVKSGGRIKSYKFGEKLFESFIQSCVPHWNEAVRRYSDHQVNMVLHLHPDRWEIADQECKVCNGQGTINKSAGPGVINKTACGNCHGVGKVAIRTPFSTKLIRPQTKTGAAEYTNVPTPPMGYATRDIGTIDYLNKEWQQNIKQGLSSLNMEFLMMEPAVNSGIAKQYDRSELNTFLYTVASHIIENDLNPLINIILSQRYAMNYSSDQIRGMMPVIKVPVKYDTVVSSFLLEATKYVKDAGVPGAVLDQMYLEYAAKEFGKDSMAYIMIENITMLDPLAHMTVDEKMTTLMNKGCTEKQYVISSQLENFLIRAFSEDANFDKKSFTQKTDAIGKYADEVIKSTKTEVLPAQEPFIAVA